MSGKPGCDGKSGCQAMWLWFGFWGLPIQWLFGIPFGSTLFLLPTPSVQMAVAMVVVLASSAVVARKALNY